MNETCLSAEPGAFAPAAAPGPLRVPSSGGRSPGVRAVRDAVHPATRARPVLLPAVPDGVEPRARRRGRRARRRDRLVGHRDDRGGRRGSPSRAPGTCTGWRPRWARRCGGSPWSTRPWSAITSATTRRALASKDVRRRKTEGTLEGLRYVRNQLGKSVEPDEFVRPAIGDDGAGGWTWRPLPEPGLDGLALAGAAVGAEQVPRLPGTARRSATSPGPSPAARSSSRRPRAWSSAAPRPDRATRGYQLATASELAAAPSENDHVHDVLEGAAVASAGGQTPAAGMRSMA